jgi:hypothetical protein
MRCVRCSNLVSDSRRTHCLICEVKDQAEHLTKINKPGAHQVIAKNRVDPLPPKPDNRSRLAKDIERYGLTTRQYLDLVEGQADRCAICGEPPPFGRRLSIDHDHATGDVRGLLCGPCNLGLGYFKDDPERMEAAAEYIRRPPVLDHTDYRPDVADPDEWWEE